jgi:hypothetical protein
LSKTSSIYCCLVTGAFVVLIQAVGAAVTTGSAGAATAPASSPDGAAAPAASPDGGGTAPAQPAAPETNTVRNAAIVSSPDGGTATGSPISIGTLYGIAVPLFKPEFFQVTNGRLERIRSAQVSDYIDPAVYVLPSIAVYTKTKSVKKPKTTAAVQQKLVTKGWTGLDAADFDYKTTGNTLSVILPAGVTSSSVNGVSVSIGVGAAFGSNIGPAEVGIAGAFVWNQQPFLTDAQQAAIGMPVGAATGISDQIGTRLRPSFALGLYLTPAF